MYFVNSLDRNLRKCERSGYARSVGYISGVNNANTFSNQADYFNIQASLYEF